jgi:hypothetical protein
LHLEFAFLFNKIRLGTEDYVILGRKPVIKSASISASATLEKLVRPQANSVRESLHVRYERRFVWTEFLNCDM